MSHWTKSPSVWQPLMPKTNSHCSNDPFIIKKYTLLVLLRGLSPHYHCNMAAAVPYIIPLCIIISHVLLFVGREKLTLTPRTRTSYSLFLHGRTWVTVWSSEWCSWQVLSNCWESVYFRINGPLEQWEFVYGITGCRTDGPSGQWDIFQTIGG